MTPGPPIQVTFATDEAYEDMREAGAIDGDPVEWAEDILLIERARELLLGLSGTAP